MGTGENLRDAEEEPDDTTFGFVVISAPDEVHVSLGKRDGSLWELMDCPDTDSKDAQTIRIICTDTSKDSKCDHITEEMEFLAPLCKYLIGAVLVITLLRSHLKSLLIKPFRDLQGRSVYNLTFDYNFQRVPRDFRDAQMRINSSNQPGYWDSVVDRPGGEEGERHARRVKRGESGYHKNRRRWMEDEWREAYRNRVIERDELHKRWFGEDVINWLAQMIFVGEAEVTKELNHHVNEKVELFLIDVQSRPCPLGPAQAQANIRSTTTAEIDVETSFGFTIITALHDGLDLSRSYLYFRNAGEQTYPQENENPPQALDEPDRETKTVGKPSFDASVTANGEIAIHLKPTVTFGIVFDDRWKVDKCAVDLVLDGYVIGHAEAHFSLNGDNSSPFSYGIDAGSDIYAQITAPELFGWGSTKRVTLATVPPKVDYTLRLPWRQ
ncbi:hypothetical protein BDV06DRAFT_224783 [Aspergillus oleicola]